MSCYWFALCNPVMSGTRLRYLRSAWGPVISLLFGDPPYQMMAPFEQLVLMGGPKYTTYLAWSCTLSMCGLPSWRYRLSTGGPDSGHP
jgi:hypothetical protein